MHKKSKKTIKILSDDQLQKIRKILILQHKPFGDILLNTAYFPELRKKFPDAQIDFLIQKPYLTILEDNPYLDNLVVMAKVKGWSYVRELFRIICQIRKQKYDLVIDQLRGTSTARIVMFCGAPFRLGFIKQRWNFLYNLKAYRGETRYYARMKFDLLAPLGIQETDHNIEYHVQEESKTYINKWLKEQKIDPEKLIVFSPGTPVKRKQWKLENYAELADLIHSKTAFRVVLLWGPGEDKDVFYIREHMKTKPIVAPPTNFNQAGALLQQARILIVNDGGINHLAVSQNTPSIAIFGPTSNPKKWTAWHSDIHFYIRDWDFKTKGDNSFNISAQQVFDKILEFFSEKVH